MYTWVTGVRTLTKNDFVGPLRITGGRGGPPTPRTFRLRPKCFEHLRVFPVSWLQLRHTNVTWSDLRCVFRCSKDSGGLCECFVSVLMYMCVYIYIYYIVFVGHLMVNVVFYERCLLFNFQLFNSGWMGV